MGNRSHIVQNILWCIWLLDIRQKVELLFSPTCSFQCWAFESWHVNSYSFALHKLHFHCDSKACPAWQPIACLTINNWERSLFVWLWGNWTPNEMAPLENEVGELYPSIFVGSCFFSKCNRLTWNTRW